MRAKALDQFLYLLWYRIKSIFLSPFHWCLVGVYWLLLGYILRIIN